ncbi:S8 family peptidase [Altericroceibacterium endophyticum]|uniref:S8 family serine peptidase n=1 Tax=Altericroceibacterium endophyticum TaxID=1808508 RepID=A0A6I4T851_9SPHN|nr:S8 family peptidase [Altericroceibacterium endophyticum]MXO66957.1 S8 family serine peptidase [Altericroceibacterium endophyticum]
MGHTGDGVTIAVVDTGIDVDSPEFAGRISAFSRDMFDGVDTRGVNATDDHGTNVSLVAAAARNGSGILGMAWDATIMALRADTPGSCGADNPTSSNTNCSFANSTIADAVTYAADNGAKVINLSLGGSRASLALQRAVEDAVNAGVLVVVAAGNDGRADPDGFALSLADDAAGGVLIVGSIDEDGSISSFSNRAGAGTSQFIMARGGLVCCVYEDGQIYEQNGTRYLLQGTSFAAPQVAGAAALLAQAFPNLTGAQIAQLLLETAHDAGAAGTDEQYGRGVLDVAEAFAPQGVTRLAESSEAFPLSALAGTTSPAMGDAISAASLAAVVLDKYSRAYDVNLSSSFQSAPVSQRLQGALAGHSRAVGAASGNMSVAFTIDASGDAMRQPQTGSLQLAQQDAEAARVLAGRVTMRLAPDMQVGFAFSESADGLAAQLQGQDRPAFMVARSAGGDDGVYRTTDAAIAARRQFGAWGLTARAEMGETVNNTLDPVIDVQRLQQRDRVRSFGLSLDRRFGNLSTALGLSLIDEDNSVLGARFHDGFGLQGAQTMFVDAEAGWNFARKWRLGAAMRLGQTTPQGGLLADGSRLMTQAWSFDVERAGVFAQNDRIGFRVSQPLRVNGGALNFNLPVAYDYASNSARYAVQSLSLSPNGRELMGELAWSGALWSGHASASVFFRHEPGHYAQLPADKGVGLRWSRGF